MPPGKPGRAVLHSPVGTGKILAQAESAAAFGFTTSCTHVRIRWAEGFERRCLGSRWIGAYRGIVFVRCVEP